MDFYCVVLLQFLVLTCNFLPTATAVSSKWKRRKEECKMKLDKIRDQQEMTSLWACLMSCENMPKCQAVSWPSNGNTCLLSDKNVVDDKRVQYRKWDLATGWLTYSQVNFPIARLMNPILDTIIMTFVEAVQACLSQGAEIATPDQLQEARDFGMDTCSCGWLSNGGNGGVVPLSGACNNIEFTDVVSYCNNTRAVAWCKLN